MVGLKPILALCFVWIEAIRALSTFKEETLYMLKNDLKIIRLKDFLRGSIDTTFVFKAVDPLANATANLTDLTIYQSRSDLFSVPKSSLNSLGEDILDTWIATDNLLLTRTPTKYRLHSVLNGTATEAAVIQVPNYRTLANFMHDQTQLLLYYRDYIDNQEILMELRLIDPSNKLSITELKSNASVNVTGVNQRRFLKYRFHCYERNTSSFLIMGISPDFVQSSNPVVKCKTRFIPDSGSQAGSWISSCNVMNVVTGFNSSYEQVLFQTISEVTIRIVARKGHNMNDFYFTDCAISADGSQMICQPIQRILKIPMYNGTLNRALDLGGGHFAIWTRQSLSYSLNLDYTLFEKIYTQTDESLIQPRQLTDTDANDTISFSIKTPAYICVGIRGSPTSRNTTSVLIIEYTSSPPDISTQRMDSLYLRLQNDYLVFTEDRATGLHLRAYKFIDPYIEVRGDLVTRKEGYTNTSVGLLPFKFAIEARSNTSLLQTKNFTAVLVTGALDSTEFSLPFDNLTLIKGALMSVVVKEDYAIGNDLSLDVKASAPNVGTFIERVHQSSVKINRHSNNASEELNNLLNDPAQAPFFERVILVHDNIGVLGYRRGQNSSIFVIFLRQLSNKSETYNDEQFKGVTIAEAYCKLSFDGEISASYKLVKAALVNFNHLIVVMESTAQFIQKPYYSQIFNIDPLTWRSPTQRAIGDQVHFEATRSNSSLILYPFPGSATIIYFREGSDTVKPMIGMIRFTQLNNGNYTNQTLDVSHDSVRIGRFTHIYPDFSSKYNFYIRITENIGTNASFIGFIRNITNNGNSSLRLVLHRPLQSSVDLMGKSTHFCAANEEVVSIRDEETDVGGTLYNMSRLYITPSKAFYTVHEKMVRRLPLESLNLTQVAFADCMEDRNSMIVFAYNNITNNTAIINYDFDKVTDPRRRIESVMYLPDVKPRGLLVSSKSVSSVYKDFILVSYIDETTGRRMFKYVMQPVKIFKFDIYSPMSIDDSFDLNLNLTINHSLSKLSVNKSLKVQLRPLDYKTNITVNPSKKFPKKPRSYQLETGLMDIQGHVYGMQLRNVKNGSLLHPQDPDIRLMKRLVQVETFQMKNSLQVRCQNDFVFVRQADGDIKVFTDRSNRNKSVTLRLQSNFMASNVVPKVAIPNYNASNPELVYLLIGEEVMNGINLRYMEIKYLPGNLNETELVSQNLVMEFTGTHRRIDSIFCQRNLYVVLLPKIQDSILVLRINTTANESDPFIQKVPWQFTLKFASEISTLDIICLSDSDRGHVSLGLIVLYSNLTQMLYSLKDQLRPEQVTPIVLNYFQGKNYFVNDLECEGHGNKTYQVNNVNAYLSEIRCFYSTRWADDYLVYYAIESIGSEVKLVEAKLIEEIEEVKNLDIIKAIVEEDWIMVVGKNLKEHYEDRDYYVMIYKFEPGKKTYVKTYFSLKRSLDVDPETFRDVIDFNHDSTLVFLAKTNKSSNSYDTIHRLNITGMKLDVLSTNFDPSQIDLEFLDISQEPLYKIRLLNLFDLINEVRSLEDTKVANIITACLGVSTLLLLGSAVFYVVSNRIYLSRKQELKKSRVYSQMKKEVIKMSKTFTEDHLDEDDSDGILEEIILRSKTDQAGAKS